MTEVEACRTLDAIASLIRLQGRLIRELQSDLTTKVNTVRIQEARIVELQQQLAANEGRSQ